MHIGDLTREQYVCCTGLVASPNLCLSLQLCAHITRTPWLQCEHIVGGGILSCMQILCLHCNQGVRVICLHMLPVIRHELMQGMRYA